MLHNRPPIRLELVTVYGPRLPARKEYDGPFRILVQRSGHMHDIGLLCKLRDRDRFVAVPRLPGIKVTTDGEISNKTFAIGFRGNAVQSDVERVGQATNLGQLTAILRPYVSLMDTFGIEPAHDQYQSVKRALPGRPHITNLSVCGLEVPFASHTRWYQLQGVAFRVTDIDGPAIVTQLHLPFMVSIANPLSSTNLTVEISEPTLRPTGSRRTVRLTGSLVEQTIDQMSRAVNTPREVWRWIARYRRYLEEELRIENRR